MKTVTKFASILILLFLATPVLLLSGCGSDVADKQGCPSGSYLANATDIIVGPGDAETTVVSTNLFPYPGGTHGFTPLSFIIYESDGITPRNNICLTAYTDGFWYTDVTYSTTITGPGPNALIVATNDAGVATFYWSSTILPPANLAVGATAGADIVVTSFVDVRSGTKSALFTATLTVQGQPAP